MELVVGRVAKSHGIRGEIAVEVRTDAPDERFAVGTVLDGRRPRANVTTQYTVEAARQHAGRLLLRLEGVADRSAADALRGTLFVVDSAELPPSEDPDEFYDHELEGLAALGTDGARIGTVGEVLHTAGGELLSIRRDEGAAGPAEVLVPFVREIVTAVSVEGGHVVIDPPTGLLDPAEAESADDGPGGGGGR